MKNQPKKEKKSEDDEIKKGLIKYFKDFNLDTFAGLDPKKILSWLKKQGDKDKLIKIKIKINL